MASCRAQKLEHENLHLHHRLDTSDVCYFIGEYTSGADYSHSRINSIIYNFKKKPSTSLTNPTAYRYKLNDITQVAKCFSKIFKQDAVESNLTFVPIPPSKTPSHPEYDDRIEQICLQMAANFETPDVISLIQNIDDTHETHNLSVKPTPEELLANYSIVSHVGYVPRGTIVLVDDVLTTGSHFKACKQILLSHYPNQKIIGLFVARRVFPNPFADFDMD